MKKNFLFFIILFELLLLFKCHTLENEYMEEEEEYVEELEEFDNGNEDFGYFKESLKQYLIANNLFYSEKLIEPNDFKILFFEVISEGDPNSSPPYLKKNI